MAGTVHSEKRAAASEGDETLAVLEYGRGWMAAVRRGSRDGTEGGEQLQLHPRPWCLWWWMSMPVVIYGSRTITEGSLAANFRSLAVLWLSLLSASAHTNARHLAPAVSLRAVVANHCHRSRSPETRLFARK